MTATRWMDRVGDAGLRRLGLRRATAVDAGLYTGGNVLYQGARFVVYLVAARVLGPELYGLWNGLLLVLTNGVSYGHGGVLNAMNREVPYNLGRQAPEANRRIVDTSFTIALIVAALLAIGCLVLSATLPLAPATRFGWRMLALLILLQQVQVFFELLLRSHSRFRVVALEQAGLAVLLLIVVTGLTVALGFPGFLWGQAASYLLVSLLLLRYAPVRPRLRWDWREAMNLARIGFPIMAVGFTYGMLTSLDRVMIISWLGKEALGLYSLAFMAYGTMMLIPRSVSQMVYPRLAETYGRTGDPVALRRLVYHPLKLLALLMGPLLVLTFVAGPWLIRILLPEYVGGIPAFHITLVAVFFLSYMGTLGNLLNTVNRQRQYLLLQAGALALNFVLNLAALSAGLGITGVAWATLATHVTYVGALWLTVHRVLHPRPAAA